MAAYELRYVKTGWVPGREDLLYQGGDVNTIHDMAVPLFYLRYNEGVLLVDTSFNLEDARVLGNADVVKRNPASEEPLLALENDSIRVGDVKTIILTHGHFDHVGFVDAFPNATIYVHRRELAWLMGLPAWSIGYGPFSFERLSRVWDRIKPIDEDQVQIIPGVQTYLAGGHSAGSLAVLIDTPARRACLCGDNCFLYKNIDEKLPIGLTNNLYESMSFLEKLPALAEIFIPGHDRLIYEKYPQGIIV